MTDLATIQNTGMTTDEVLFSKKKIAELMSKVLKNGEHYGVIPGTQKPTLYKAGAEVVALTFGIHPKMEIKKEDLDGGHREYEVTCTMYRNTDNMVLAAGVGLCSTMESKYRWRNIKKFNPETKKQEEERIENPNLQDLFNTILKMAKKRAFVDAVITATAASDFVTQDVEDFAEVIDVTEPEPWEAEITMIDNMESLKAYWVANKGKGKKFDAKIMERKAILELNFDKNDQPK